MTEYSELVKALRHCGKDLLPGERCKDSCPYGDIALCLPKLKLDAADAIEELQQIADHHEQTAKDYWKEACEYKAQLPKRGEWIWIQKANGGQYKGCSVCHAPIPTDSMLDYLDDEDCDFCYSCGAKMEVQE